jgi:hypothetical protein
MHAIRTCTCWAYRLAFVALLSAAAVAFSASLPRLLACSDNKDKCGHEGAIKPAANIALLNSTATNENGRIRCYDDAHTQQFCARRCCATAFWLCTSQVLASSRAITSNRYAVSVECSGAASAASAMQCFCGWKLAAKLATAFECCATQQ